MIISPCATKKIKFSKILHINDWLFKHPVQSPCTIYILIFFGAMLLNVKGTLCLIYSSPSPAWCSILFFSGVVFVQHRPYLYWHTNVTITDTPSLMHFTEEKKYIFFKLCQIFPCRKESIRRQRRWENTLGNNMGDRPVMLWLMQFEFGIWISNMLPCIYIADHKHTQLWLVQNL